MNQTETEEMLISQANEFILKACALLKPIFNKPSSGLPLYDHDLDKLEQSLRQAKSASKAILDFIRKNNRRRLSSGRDEFEVFRTKVIEDEQIKSQS